MKAPAEQSRSEPRGPGPTSAVRAEPASAVRAEPVAAVGAELASAARAEPVAAARAEPVAAVRAELASAARAEPVAAARAEPVAAVRAEAASTERRPGLDPVLPRPRAPGGDTAFMEQILRELSEQNEHARVDRTPRAPAVGTGARLAADVAAGALSPSRPPVIRVERDSGFRTAEGTPNTRAYLPAKTLAPGRSAPLPTATVHVADPRRLPTLRVPRARVPSAVPSSERAPESRPLAVRWWLGAVMLAAIAGAIVVLLAARIGTAPAGASGFPPGSALPASPPALPPPGLASSPRPGTPSSRTTPP